MDEDVPHSDDLSPRNLGEGLSQLGGETRARFADDLQMMADENTDQLVRVEDLPPFATCSATSSIASRM
jgi:hypothetical protein